MAVPNTALRFRPEGASPDQAGQRPGGQGSGAAGAGQRRDRGARSEGGQGQGDGQSWRRDRDADGDDAAPVVVKRTLYVLVEGEPVPRSVTTGLTDGRVTEITGGELKEGETVIVGVAGQNNQGQRGGQQQQRGPRIL